jgi:hypothetical protein
MPNQSTYPFTSANPHFHRRSPSTQFRHPIDAYRPNQERRQNPCHRLHDSIHRPYRMEASSSRHRLYPQPSPKRPPRRQTFRKFPHLPPIQPSVQCTEPTALAGISRTARPIFRDRHLSPCQAVTEHPSLPSSEKPGPFLPMDHAHNRVSDSRTFQFRDPIRPQNPRLYTDFRVDSNQRCQIKIPKFPTPPYTALVRLFIPY